MITTTEIGRFGERAAARFLQKNGYRISATNYHASHYEIDIVAEDQNSIVFVEVKTRESKNAAIYGAAAESVTYSKRSRTLSASRSYLYENGNPENKEIRFDVIEVYIKKIKFSPFPMIEGLNHIKDAFRG
jgi:putative endonuclease